MTVWGSVDDSDSCAVFAGAPEISRTGELISPDLPELPR